MAYSKEELVFNVVFDKVDPIEYLDEKWSVSLGFKNYKKAQLCLWTHTDSDEWAGAGRIDYLRRSITAGVCSIIVSTVLKVQVWILSLITSQWIRLCAFTLQIIKTSVRDSTTQTKIQ
jgi:hypothetical protein